MCGRYVSAHTAEELADYFTAEPVAGASLAPSYNVAPTNSVYSVLVGEGIRRLDVMRWGLIPSWAKDAKVGGRMINARSETLTERNAYRGPFKKRRCIIPADGFYEWVSVSGQKGKQPMHISRSDGEPMAFAGLWERWRPPAETAASAETAATAASAETAGLGAGSPANPDGEPAKEVRSVSIITGQANERIAKVHDRMPVILPPAAWEEWLDPTQQDTGSLSRLLVPAPSELFQIQRVSTEVNNPRNKSEHLIRPI